MFFSVFVFFVCLFYKFPLHLLFSLSLTLITASFTVLITLLRYYFISLQHALYHISVSFIFYFHYIYANCWHLLLSLLHIAITSSLYNTTCNRFYYNYVINICLRQLLLLCEEVLPRFIVICIYIYIYIYIYI